MNEDSDKQLAVSDQPKAKKLPVATIMKEHPRYAAFAEIFGERPGATVVVPIMGYAPEWASAPGMEKAEFYKIDLSRCSDAQIGKLASYLQMHFMPAVAVEQVEALLREDGFVPLKNEHCCVAIDTRFFQ